MAEELKISHSVDKSKKYQVLLPQIKALVMGETDLIANMANIVAAIKQSFDFLWVGFYLAKGKELVLGPFQGTIACVRLKKGKGVCGTAWENKTTILVEDVNKFEGHIFCNATAKSEIVVPIFDNNNEVFAVLDIDSEHLAHFDKIDQKHIEEIAQIVEQLV